MNINSILILALVLSIGLFLFTRVKCSVCGVKFNTDLRDAFHAQTLTKGRSICDECMDTPIPYKVVEK